MAEKDNQNTPSNEDADKDFGLPKVKITPLQPTESKEEKPSETPIAPVNKPEPKQPEAEQPKKQEPEKKKQESTPVAAAPKVEAKKPEKDKDQTTTFSSVSKKEEKKKDGKKGWVWAALILLFVGFSAVLFWYVYLNEEPAPAPQVTEQPAPTPPLVVEEEEPVVEEEPETFTLTQIKSRAEAPRYFLVVGSFIDEDMALDYSERLIEKGINTYIVYPYGQIAYYRLAVGEFENVALALEELERVQADYQENLWVLKY
ncbi:SPOR domain-containing protein [Litoribacter ruber]|uniref:SPOR domain-containing protein n=1 Tax=Litoribacter ruber TaxID=702568 RepID=UPI001BD9A3BB|nr:SPOR domain-containing protein [Litoribacter ruber]MBT0810257.1 SPOR domain-containing protein [Litoribacter ruber]